MGLEVITINRLQQLEAAHAARKRDGSLQVALLGAVVHASPKRVVITRYGACEVAEVVLGDDSRIALACSLWRTAADWAGQLHAGDLVLLYRALISPLFPLRLPFF